MKNFLLLVGCGLALQLQAASLLFKNGTIHPVSGPPIASGQVLVENGKVVSVDEARDVAADETIDLQGRHLYPGMIAAATTLGLVEIDAIRATRDFEEVGEYTPEVRSWVAVNPDSEMLLVARLNGITHIVPVPSGGIVAGQSGVVALHGWTTEEMTIKSPVAMNIFWPSMELNTTPKERFKDKEKWKSLEDQSKERQIKLKELDDFFSEAEAYAKERAGRKDSSGLVPAWEAMLPVVAKQIPLFIHADEYHQIKSAVEWAVSRKYKMILGGGRDAWMLADLLATNQVPVVFQRVFSMNDELSATPARDIDPYDVHFSAPAVLNKAGVKVILSDGLGGEPAENIRNLPYIAAQAVAFGLPEEIALKAITLYPAQILGVADRLGSIEAGKEASFVEVDGDILDVRAHVKQVWIAGEKVSMETRQTRLYQKYKNRPKKSP